MRVASLTVVMAGLFLPLGVLLGGAAPASAFGCPLASDFTVSNKNSLPPFTICVVNSNVTLTIANTGSLYYDGSTLLNDGTVNIGGVLVDLTSSTDISEDKLTNFGTVFNSNVLAALGTVTNAGTFINSLGTASIGTLNNAGGLTNTGTLNLQDAINTVGATLDNAGTLTLGGAAVNIPVFPPAGFILGLGTFTNNGTITNDAGSQLNNVETLVNNGNLTNGVGGTLTNKGSLIVSAGATLINSGSMTNAGNEFCNISCLTIQARGTLSNTAGSSYVQTSGRTIVDGTLNSVPAIQIQAGSLVGTGTINGNVAMTGRIVNGIERPTIQPGEQGTPGTLTINGNFNTSVTSSFDELIGGNGLGNGRVIVNGTATLGADSLLNIVLLNGFTPLAGETFTLMDFLGGSGTFANAPTTGFQMDGINWTISYNANDIILDAGSPVPEPSSVIVMGPSLAALFGYLWRKRAATLHDLS